MILGGKGGANTATGRSFEHRKDFLKLLEDQPGYTVKRKGRRHPSIVFEGQEVGLSIRQHSLYRYLEDNGVTWRTLISKRLLPDEAVFVPDKKLISIVEMKFQQVAGSVDEKLQTCHFKLRQYRKLFAPLEYKVNYIYLLGDWFKKPEYSDVLDYIRDVDCYYYFDRFPLADIGLPEHELQD